MNKEHNKKNDVFPVSHFSERQVLQRRQGLASGRLTIRELNELLDKLASSENRLYHLIFFCTLSLSL